MLKLIHAADLHLDSPFAGLSPEKAARRRAELREVPARLARLVREEGAQLVLLSGDLFDTERLYPETVQALLPALGEMAVPVFIAPGNHDPYTSRSPYAALDWPENVRIFASPAMESAEVPELNCTVHGCAFTSSRREDDPLAGFTAPDDGRIHLLCVHGEVGAGGSYGPISPASLERSGAAYAALGHVHAMGSGRAGGTLWAYPGCPEGRGFDELGPKGALAVALGAPDGPSVRFVPLCRRQYRIETVDVGEFPVCLPREESPDLVRFLLTGESRFAPDLAALTARAEPLFFYTELYDRTALPRALWDRAGEDTLTGLFLRVMAGRCARHPEDDTLRLAARFGLAALEGGEDAAP